MFNKIHFLIFLLIFFSYSLVYGQKNVPLENGSIFYLNDGSKLIGKVINDFQDTKQIEIITGDTVTLSSDLLNKQYLFDDNDELFYTVDPKLEDIESEMALLKEHLFHLRYLWE